MKNQVLNELTHKGIFVNDQLLNETDKNNLKKDFEIKIKKKDTETFKINDDKEIKQISETLYNFLQRDYIKNSISEYFGSEVKCSTVLFSRTKPEIKKNDSENIMAASVLGFHNDDEGKQIKINILLSDLSKDSNGLEYAIFSHKVSLIDRFIVSILRIFGFFKGWNKHFVNYQKNKFQGKRVNFMSENDVKKKFQIIKVYGNSGLVYIFDTNGFHRQGSVLSKNLLEKQRELITIYLDPKKN